ncbi:MAG: hypothetical protein IT318_04205 [Anaerolineales bacterium]|nr:hypothetical protein [Anaerolineales bacterium]
MFQFTITPLTLFVVVAGALLVALPYLLRTWPALPPGTRLGRLERRLAQLRHWLAVKFRYNELGGYVHDTSMTQYIPPTVFHYVTGSWSHAAGAVTDTIAVINAAADATTTCNIPVVIPSNSASQKGAYLRSVEIDFEILTGACDAVTAVFNKVTRGADGAVAVVAAQTFTYDSGHDGAAERIDVDQHKMTLTLTTPIWLDNDEYALVELTLDRGANTVVHMLGAFANYTLRL